MECWQRGRLHRIANPEIRILHTSSYMLQSLRWWSRGPENRQPGRAMQVRILPAALRKLESLMQAFFFFA